MKRIFNFKFYRPLVVLFSLVLLFCTVTPCVGAFNGVVDLNDTPKSETLQSTDTPILEEGVYCILNDLVGARLTVPGFAMASGSTLRCVEDSRSISSLTSADKNSLWWVSHIYDDIYSIRPLHKINMALDLGDNNGNIQLYSAGIYPGNALYTSRWIITQPTDFEGTDEYTLRNYHDQTKALYGNSIGEVYADEYVVRASTRWEFIRLSDKQVKSLEGIMIYGDFAVANGSSTKLSASVFSATSMNQSVTFSLPSGYFGITVTSNGTVTGTGTGLSRVKAVSNVDPNITGSAQVVVMSGSRRAATFVGIPDVGHDHTSCYTDIEANLKGIYGSSAQIYSKQAMEDGEEAVSDIIGSKVFIFRGHGVRNAIYFGESTLYSAAMFSSDVSDGTSREFSKTELVLYMSCLTGEGGKHADNLVRATYENGAKNTIGFSVSITCGDANNWIKDFMKNLRNEVGSSGVITQNAISNVISSMYYTNYGSISGRRVIFLSEFDY